MFDGVSRVIGFLRVHTVSEDFSTRVSAAVTFVVL